MTTRVRAIARAVVVVAAAGMLGAVSGVAQAAPAGDTSSHNVWHRYHQPDFVVPAGQGCAFRVAAHVLYDREFFRTTSHYLGGAPRVQVFRGPLIIQYVNVHTGRKVIRNQSGVATEKYTRGGRFASIKVVSGHFGAALGPGSVPGEGVYYIGGQGTSLVVGFDGRETVHLGPKGTAQNLCPILHS